MQIISKCVKNMPPNPVLEKVKTLVYEFKDTIPVVTALRNPALTQAHWRQIKEMIGYDFDISEPDFTLQSLIDLDVQVHQARIQELSTQATQEEMLEQEFGKIKKKWLQEQLNFQSYKEDVRFYYPNNRRAKRRCSFWCRSTSCTRCSTSVWPT